MLCSLLLLGACASTAPPLPDMTFAHIEPFPVKVAAVDIENRFNPALDPGDVSSSFPSAPDVVLRRYAERRLSPAGMEGTLKFVIEDAHIHHSVEQADNKFTNWTGLDRKDVYDVSLRIRLYALYDTGVESNHAILNLRRTISIPQRFSLAEKEREKFNCLELLMDDVDREVTEALRVKMNIAGVYKEVPLASLLAAPEIRRQ